MKQPGVKPGEAPTAQDMSATMDYTPDNMDRIYVRHDTDGNLGPHRLSKVPGRIALEFALHRVATAQIPYREALEAQGTGFIECPSGP